ncbi:TlpA family protein disulfide reductase [Fulvivirga sp. RKSG066]|uniref:TlpA family protein disulfide reductase n=1 Tax=Fulvivirga aurantia TaxID=2529383 RepID=UPI0012BD2F40|nr:TlpA disulfide reductase family protein [Fulvivirga aurantia]MTI21691.1 TlpA family protein disulfide reductase [Fulvivirga aurantia]
MKSIAIKLAVLLYLITLPYVLSAQKFDLENQGPDVGEPFPIYNYITLDGDSINSETFTDRTILLNIWFVGCKGCKQEEPTLKELTKQFQDDNILFISLCMSKPERIRKYIEKNDDFGYKIISTNRKEVENRYSVVASPTHFLIKNGVLIDKHTGPFSPKNIAYLRFKKILSSE